MKKLLIVVDYQTDFVTGSLGFQEAVLLEDYICKLIQEYKENNDDVIFTLDSHDKNYLTSQEGKNLPVEHCIKNSKGWNLYGKVKDLAGGCKQIEKPTFPSLALGNYLKEKDYDEITLVGVVSNICVISNAIIAKAALPEATIIVDKKGIASNDPHLHQTGLEIMENLQIIIKNKD